MPETPEPPVPATSLPPLDADKVYFSLAHPGRRRLLESLAMKRSCTAAEVVPSGGLKRDATSKQLQELVKAGLCNAHDDDRDARRQRYTLLPGLVATKSASGRWEMDLGCCSMRWG
jgi:hypothetical protein